MSEERLDDLERLDLERFDRREHAALSWVNAFLTCPDGVPTRIEREYETLFSDEERTHIAAAMKAMFCVNLAVNTQRFVTGELRGTPEPAGESACLIPR